MGSRVEIGRSSQAVYRGSSSSFSSGAVTIGTFSTAASIALILLIILRLLSFVIVYKLSLSEFIHGEWRRSIHFLESIRVLDGSSKIGIFPVFLSFFDFVVYKNINYCVLFVVRNCFFEEHQKRVKTIMRTAPMGALTSAAHLAEI